jgi:hypothetical protein
MSPNNFGPNFVPGFLFLRLHSAFLVIFLRMDLSLNLVGYITDEMATVVRM